MHIDAADTFLFANAAVPMQQLQQAAVGGAIHVALHFTHDDVMTLCGEGGTVACDMAHAVGGGEISNIF